MPRAVGASISIFLLVILGLWVGENVNLLPLDASTNATVYDQLFKVLLNIVKGIIQFSKWFILVKAMSWML